MIITENKGKVNGKAGQCFAHHGAKGDLEIVCRYHDAHMGRGQLVSSPGIATQQHDQRDSEIGDGSKGQRRRNSDHTLGAGQDGAHENQQHESQIGGDRQRLE